MIPGATVEISSPALMPGTRSAVTSENGTYLFLNLPIGRYTVKASLSGFKTMVRENIDVSADSTVTLDLILPVGEIKETVTVSAAGPIVDTKASTVDTRFRTEMLEKLPTSRDAFYDLALTAPGMFEGSGAPSQTTEFQSPTAYGSATNENVFLINGVDATSPRAGSFGALVNVNYDSVEEVRIVASGSKAEYASFSGAAATACAELGLRAIVYLEVFGRGTDQIAERFAATRDRLDGTLPDTVRLGVSPHAPYTCSTELYAACFELGLPVATHLAESADEQAWLRGEGGEWDKTFAYFDRAWEGVLGNLKKRFESGPQDWTEWMKSLKKMQEQAAQKK